MGVRCGYLLFDDGGVWLEMVAGDLVVGMVMAVGMSLSGYGSDGFRFGFELVVGGVTKLLDGGGGLQVVRWVARRWLWMAEKERKIIF